MLDIPGITDRVEHVNDLVLVLRDGIVVGRDCACVNRPTLRDVGVSKTEKL